MADSSYNPPHDNRGSEILAISCSVIAVATVTVVLRMWVRLKVVRRPGWDDWLMALAMFIALVELGLIIPEVIYGAGQHNDYIVPQSNVLEAMKLNYATQPICLISLLFAKISVGIFYLRLTPARGYRYIIVGTTVLATVMALINIMFITFQCWPIAFAWDPSIPDGRCVAPASLRACATFGSAISALTDVIFAVLPIPMVWHLKLSWKIKMGLTGALSLGFLSAASAITKISFMWSFGEHADFLYQSTDITNWAMIEVATAIAGGSIPTLKPLFRPSSWGVGGEHHLPMDEEEHKNPAHHRNEQLSTSWKGRSSHFEYSAFDMYGRWRNVADVSSGGRSKTSKTRTETTRNTSQEWIVPEEEQPADGIQRTLAVHISVAEPSDEETATEYPATALQELKVAHLHSTLR